MTFDHSTMKVDSIMKVVYILLLQGVCEGSSFISYKALKRIILLSIRDTLKPEL